MKNLMSYSPVRELELTDESEVDVITKKFVANGYRLHSLIELVVKALCRSAELDPGLLS